MTETMWLGHGNDIVYTAIKSLLFKFFSKYMFFMDVLFYVTLLTRQSVNVLCTYSSVYFIQHSKDSVIINVAAFYCHHFI